MLNQKTLFGETLENPQSKEELKAVCCEACYTAAQGSKCTCKCNGAFHALGKRHNKNGQALAKLVYQALDGKISAAEFAAGKKRLEAF